MGDLLRLRERAFFQKDFTKVVTKDLVSYFPDNTYSVQVYMGSHATLITFKVYLVQIV